MPTSATPKTPSPTFRRHILPLALGLLGVRLVVACSGSDSLNIPTNVKADSGDDVIPPGKAEPVSDDASTQDVDAPPPGKDAGNDAGGPPASWTRQFGTNKDDDTRALTVDPSGNVIVVGSTVGAFQGQNNAGKFDGFIRKFDALGTTVWTRQFGTNDWDIPTGIASDATGNVYVVGYTLGTFAGQSSTGKQDAFVTKYDSAGTRLWIRQFGAGNNDAAFAVAINGGGDVFVAGALTVPGFDAGPNHVDAFVTKFDSSGTRGWTRMIGSPATESARGVTTDTQGNVLVGGLTGGTLTGQTSSGMNDAFVTKFTAAGDTVWTRQFGSTGNDSIASLAVDSQDNIFASGSSNGTLTGQTNAGGNDAFVQKLDSSGSPLWTHQFGTQDEDVATSVTTDLQGAVFVAGNTKGNFAGLMGLGDRDAYARKFDAAGNVVWTRLFGTNAADGASSITTDAVGDVFLAGYTDAKLPAQPSAGNADAFVMRIAP